MRNAELLQLFNGYQYQTDAFCRKWSAKIEATLNVQYPYSPDLWEKCKTDDDLKAIMLVGQMPGQWDWWGKPPILERDCFNILNCMKESRNFDRELYGSSHFFGFIKWIEEVVNSFSAVEARRACYWTNVCRTVTADPQKNKEDLKDKPEFLNDYIKSITTLPDEIKIMEPDAIIFGTGDRYKPYLEKMFSCTFVPAQVPQNVYIEQVVAEGLPEKTFLTYHPGFIMQFLGKAGANILVKELATLIKV